MTMTKLLLLLAFCSVLTACGQKGPLIVDRPINEGQEQVEGESITNDDSEDNAGSRLDRQLEGSATIINR